MYPVDANVIFDQFQKANITPEERLHFVDKLPALKKLILQKGEITDGDFDRLGFRQSRVRDGRKLNQRRTVVLTNLKLFKKSAEKSSKAAVAAATPPQNKRGRPPKEASTPNKRRHKA